MGLLQACYNGEKTQALLDKLADLNYIAHLKPMWYTIKIKTSNNNF